MGKPVILCNRPQSVVAATWCWQTLKKAPSSMKRQEKFQSYQMSQKEHQSWKVSLKCCHSQHFLRQDSCKISRNTNKIISMASTRKPQNFSAIKHQKNIFRKIEPGFEFRLVVLPSFISVTSSLLRNSKICLFLANLKFWD